MDSSFSREDSRRDFLRPNNHDLFEGNVSDPRVMYDEPEPESPGLFDEPDIRAPEKPYFEDSFFQPDDYPERQQQQQQPQDRPLFDDPVSYREPQRQETSYCKKCGFDLNPSWNSCPNCGQRVIRRDSSDDYYY